MATLCHKCNKEGATIADPCCSAPDCECRDHFAHFKCLPKWRQNEELEWAQG